MSFYRSTRMNGSLPPLLSPSMCSVSVFPLPMLQIDWERRRIVLCDLIDLSAKPVRLVDQFATSIVAIVPQFATSIVAIVPLNCASKTVWL